MHDIGGINCVNNSKPEYRELLIRWFQVGLTSPIFRQHGSRVMYVHRQSAAAPVIERDPLGQANCDFSDPWALQQYGPSGEAAYQAVIKMIQLRHSLRPYVLQQMVTVAANGTVRTRHQQPTFFLVIILRSILTDCLCSQPLNRPLSFDFPEDKAAWSITDQYSK